MPLPLFALTIAGLAVLFFPDDRNRMITHAQRRRMRFTRDLRRARDRRVPVRMNDNGSIASSTRSRLLGGTSKLNSLMEIIKDGFIEDVVYNGEIVNNKSDKELMRMIREILKGGVAEDVFEIGGGSLSEINNGINTIIREIDRELKSRSRRTYGG